MRRLTSTVTLTLGLALSALATPIAVPLITQTPAGAATTTDQATSSNVSASTTAATTASKPVFAVYYLWWSNLHWHDSLGSNYAYAATPNPLPATLDSTGCGSKTVYSGNKLTDASQKLGYDQDKAGVIENDVRTAQAAGITGFSVNWKGDGTTTQSPTSSSFNKRLEALFAAANKVTLEGKPFKVMLNYQASASLLSTTFISNDISYFAAHYRASLAMDHRYSSRPEVIWTGSWKYSDADVTTVSKAIRSKVWLLGDEKVSSWNANAAANFDGDSYYWSSQDPWGNPQSFSQVQSLAANVRSTRNPDGSAKTWLAPFTPGYNAQLRYGTTTCVPRNGTQTMHKLFDGNLASNPDGWMFISWNEIAEGSYIVPLTRYGATYTNEMKVITSTNH